MFVLWSNSCVTVRGTCDSIENFTGLNSFHIPSSLSLPFRNSAFFVICVTIESSLFFFQTFNVGRDLLLIRKPTGWIDQVESSKRGTKFCQQSQKSQSATGHRPTPDAFTVTVNRNPYLHLFCYTT